MPAQGTAASYGVGDRVVRSDGVRGVVVSVELDEDFNSKFYKIKWDQPCSATASGPQLLCYAAAFLAPEAEQPAPATESQPAPAPAPAQDKPRRASVYFDESDNDEDIRPLWY